MAGNVNTQGGTSTQPTIDQLLARILELEDKSRLSHDTLTQENAMLHQEIGTLRKEGERAKLEAPDRYGGAKGELGGFLIQLKAYFWYYPSCFPDEESKVVYAVSRLKDKALTWFEPILGDYFDNKHDERKDVTKKCFKSYKGFEEKIKEVFGEYDEGRRAQERLAKYLIQ